MKVGTNPYAILIHVSRQMTPSHFEKVSSSVAVQLKEEEPLDIRDENGDTGNLCRFCGKTMASKTHLRTHIEDMHFPTETPCPVCDKVFLSKPKMLRHKSKLHSEPVLVGHEETPAPEVIIKEEDPPKKKGKRKKGKRY